MDKPMLEQARERFKELISKSSLPDPEITVLVKTLTAEEAIGSPGRRDFPIVLGRERVMEASFAGATAHVFTDSPREFIGRIEDVLELPLDSNSHRAVFIGVLNAVLRHLGVIEKTLHCRDEEPEHCAREMAAFFKSGHDNVRVGLIGLNPAIAQSLTEAFGAGNVKITDLNPDNIGKLKYGVEVWDGGTRTPDLVEASDLVVLTGTTLVNGTFDDIWNEVRRQGKKYVIYGVTASGVAELMGLDRICLYGRA